MHMRRRTCISLVGRWARSRTTPIGLLSPILALIVLLRLFEGSYIVVLRFKSTSATRIGRSGISGCHELAPMARVLTATCERGQTPDASRSKRPSLALCILRTAWTVPLLWQGAGRQRVLVSGQVVPRGAPEAFTASR